MAHMGDATRELCVSEQRSEDDAPSLKSSNQEEQTTREAAAPCHMLLNALC